MRDSRTNRSFILRHQLTLHSCALTVCIALLGAKNLDRYDYTHRVGWCMDVQNRAEKRGMDPIFVAGLAFHESSYRNVTSRAGAKGVMQVMPEIHCRGDECDLVDAGLEYLQYWLDRTGSEARAICHYNSGNQCLSVSAKWATRVMKTVNKLRRICQEEKMPKVGKKKFAYTKKGTKAAKTYAKKTGKKVTKKK